MTNQDEIQFMAKILFDKYAQLALDTEQTAEVIGKAPITLKVDRGAGRGLPYTRAGRFVRYNITDVAEYLVNNRVKVMGA